MPKNNEKASLLVGFEDASAASELPDFGDEPVADAVATQDLPDLRRTDKEAEKEAPAPAAPAKNPPSGRKEPGKPDDEQKKPHEKKTDAARDADASRPVRSKEPQKSDKPVKKKDKEPAKADKVTADDEALAEKNKGAKTVFIVCMCLLSPFLAILALAILAVFAALFAALILIGGVLSAALVVIVVAGVALALIGITYGVISIITGSGFTVVAGFYEVGLGLTITGVVIIVSVLLYCAVTGLIPFLMKKLWALLKLIFRKIKELITNIYRKSTSSEI